MPENFKQEVDFFRKSSKIDRSRLRSENIKKLAEKIWQISGSKEGRDFENWKIAEYVYDFISETTTELETMQAERDNNIMFFNNIVNESKDIMNSIRRFAFSFIGRIILPKDLKNKILDYWHQYIAK